MSDDNINDRFGVPESMFGALDDDFYGAVGRIANLTALLEVRLITIHQTLAGLEQDEQTKLAASALCIRSAEVVRKAVESGELTTTASDRITRFLKEAESLLTERNDYIHNVWSSKSDRIVYGWRPGRHGKLTTEQRDTELAKLSNPSTWFTESALTRSADVVRSTVARLVELHMTWPDAFSACEQARSAGRQP